MKQQIALQNHQFSSVQSMITPLLHTARALYFQQFFNVVWRLRFCHNKHRRSLLFKYFKVSSNSTPTQWPYLVGVTGNIYFGLTNNASIWHRVCRVARNVWSINKHFHYEPYRLQVKSAIIVYTCFLFIYI